MNRRSLFKGIAGLVLAPSASAFPEAPIAEGAPAQLVLIHLELGTAHELSFRSVRNLNGRWTVVWSIEQDHADAYQSLAVLVRDDQDYVR